MKRITFTKLGRYGARPDYPGYLLLHEAHPGREFVIARGSTSSAENPSRFKPMNVWLCYDRESGTSVLAKQEREDSLGRMEVTARCALSLITPEALAARIDERVMRVTTLLLQAPP